MKIIVDTREQHPLEFRQSKLIEGVIKRKLDVGDYSIEGYEDKIAIERKSAADLFQTLGKGHRRFKKELERAKDCDYFLILIEAPFSVIRDKAFEGSHYTQMSGDVILQICFTLRIKHKIDVMFCNGRPEATGIVREVFKAYLKGLKK